MCEDARLCSTREGLAVAPFSRWLPGLASRSRQLSPLGWRSRLWLPRTEWFQFVVRDTASIGVSPVATGG